MAIFMPFQFQLKLSTLLVVLIYMTIFISSSQTQAAHQATSSSYATKPGMFPQKKMQQHKFVTEALKETHQPQRELGKMTLPMVDEGQLRMVPSGPDPLHHHRAVPKRPQTP